MGISQTTTKSLQDRRKVGKLLKDMISGRVQRSDNDMAFARKIEAIGIVHGKFLAEFYTLDLPAGSVARLIRHDHCHLPINSTKTDVSDTIFINELLALIVNALKHKVS
jgi:hypothetical protein